MVMHIAVVGGGAAGIFAALFASRVPHFKVDLFEHNNAIGKKLLVTGSGKCNLANLNADHSKYSCQPNTHLDVLFKICGVRELLDVFERLGIPTTMTDDGWYYPLSKSARNVVDILQENLLTSGVKLRVSTHVLSVEKKDRQFLLTYSENGQVTSQAFDKLIIATGGMARPELGSRGEVFPVLAQLGHTVVSIRPALGPIVVELGNMKTLQGVRVNAKASLFKGSEQLITALGNLIFTEWGLNGPAVMDISNEIREPGPSHYIVTLDLLAPFRNIFDAQLSRVKPGGTVSGFLKAFFPPKVVAYFLHLANIKENAAFGQVGKKELDLLIAKLTQVRFAVVDVKGFKDCQMSAGGVPLSEIDPRTFQSTIVEGLYLAGEVLDVVGPCGGYNLTFAFASGAVAGHLNG